MQNAAACVHGCLAGRHGRMQAGYACPEEAHAFQDPHLRTLERCIRCALPNESGGQLQSIPNGRGHRARSQVSELRAATVKFTLPKQNHLFARLDVRLTISN